MRSHGAFERLGIALVVVLASWCAAPAVQSDDIGTAITYQGSLSFSGTIANGAHDFRFSLFDLYVIG